MSPSTTCSCSQRSFSPIALCGSSRSRTSAASPSHVTSRSVCGGPPATLGGDAPASHTAYTYTPISAVTSRAERPAQISSDAIDGCHHEPEAEIDEVDVSGGERNVPLDHDAT